MNTAMATATRYPIVMPEPEYYGEVDVDLDLVLQWARENKVEGTGTDGKVTMGDIHAARLQHQLPRFRVRARTVGKSDSSPPRVVRLNQPTPPMPTTESELIDLVTSFTGTITGEVSPKLAEFILALNTGNRPLAKRSVERFVSLLRAGQWVNTGEPVIISDTGCLNDGQHRLTAVVRSGISALMDLRFGITRAAFAATGTGARRTAGNVLAIAGKPHASMQAAIGRLLVHHQAGQMQKANQVVEGHEVVAITDAEPAIGEIAALIRSLKFAPARTSPFGFALVLAVRDTNIDRVATFAHLVDSGRADEDDATRRLHVRLRDAAMAKERINQIDIAVLTIRAWNAWVSGRAVQLLKITEADRTGEGFPKVVSGG